jgi:hypothetical protein
MSQDLIDLLLYLLDVDPKAGATGRSAERLRARARGLLTGQGLLAPTGVPQDGSEGSQALVEATRTVWALVVQAEEHIEHLGELHVKDGRRLLAEVRRLLIQRGVYRKYNPVTDPDRGDGPFKQSPWDFELNGEKWIWNQRGPRRKEEVSK